jgi:4-amino-4-deoxy-L-arabinose transferase-like glycosyltransferase
MPELCINLARVSNEVLSIVLYTALLYALVRFPHELPRVRMMPVAGILIGLGLLTKAYFLTAVPAFFLIAIFFMWRWPEHRRRIMLSSLVAALCLVAIAAPWYFHVHKSTGSWSGLQPATVAPHSLFALLASIPRVNWRSGVLSIVISHVWFGAWSFLRVPKPFYFFFGTVYLLACAV